MLSRPNRLEQQEPPLWPVGPPRCVPHHQLVLQRCGRSGASNDTTVAVDWRGLVHILTCFFESKQLRTCRWLAEFPVVTAHSDPSVL